MLSGYVSLSENGPRVVCVIYILYAPALINGKSVDRAPLSVDCE